MHEVTIARPFAVGKHEVTRAQFAQFVRQAKYDAGRRWQDSLASPSDAHPVVHVNHEDAKAYVTWLAARTGKPYRLLSEAEWEYAARAGSTASRFWGDAEKDACQFANVSWCGANRALPVGRFKPNGFGLHDVLGNVWEWVEDCWNASYTGAPADGSPWLSGDGLWPPSESERPARADGSPWMSGDCDSRVGRGGSWVNKPVDIRSATRLGITSSRKSDVGFRVARTLP